MFNVIKRLFGISQKQRDADALINGQEFGEHLVSKMDSIGEEILDKKVDKFLAAFSRRLDDANGDAELIAAHYQVFREEKDNMIENMFEVVAIQLASEIEVAEEIEIGGMVAELVGSVVDPRIDHLVKGAIKIYEQKIIEISKT